MQTCVPFLSCGARTAEVVPLSAKPRGGHRGGRPDGPDGADSREWRQVSNTSGSYLDIFRWELRCHLMPDANFFFFFFEKHARLINRLLLQLFKGQCSSLPVFSAVRTGLAVFLYIVVQCFSSLQPFSAEFVSI